MAEKKGEKASFFKPLIGSDPLSNVKVKDAIRDTFDGYYKNIFIFHIVAFVSLIIGLFVLPKFISIPWISISEIAVFASVFAVTQVVTNLLILNSSIKTEAIARQNFEFSKGMSRTTTHHFETFRDHILWVKENIDSTNYPNKGIHLYTSVSTPLYGLAADDDNKSANDYLEYLEEWVEHFRSTPKSSELPVWELCFWNQESHINTFSKKSIDPDNKQPQRELLKRFKNILDDIYELSIEQKVDCRLYFSDESHTRWFYLKTSDQQHIGLMVVFSPLTESSLMSEKWELIGTSFYDSNAYKNLTRFNTRALQIQNHGALKESQLSVLSDSAGWIKQHYGMETDL